MSRQRFFALLIAALVVLSGAFYLSSKRNHSAPAEGSALLPALSGGVASVTSVSVKKGGGASVTVHKVGEQWTVVERADYPADVSKLRKLLMALRDAKIVEKKTSNPASFSAIGVEDPAQPGAISSEITITAAAGALSVIVGKAAGEGNFVRRAEENQSYTVEPSITFETEPRFWIDTKLFSLQSAQILSEQVKPNDGPAYTLHRASVANGNATATATSAAAGGAAAAPASASTPVATPAADQPFVLDAVPTGRKALEAPVLASTASAATDLTAEDVAPVADVDFKQSSTAILTLSDGAVITLTGTVAGDKHWIQIAAAKDTALSTKPQGRAFQIASYRYDALFKPLEQMLAPKDVPAAAKGAPAPKAAPASFGAPNKGAGLRPQNSPARQGPASSPTP